jgi:hypothetical protein
MAMHFLAYIPSWWKNQPSLVRGGGGVHAHLISLNLDHHVQSCGVRFSCEGRYTPSVYSTPVCTLWSKVSIQINGLTLWCSENWVLKNDETNAKNTFTECCHLWKSLSLNWMDPNCCMVNSHQCGTISLLFSPDQLQNMYGIWKCLSL